MPQHGSTVEDLPERVESAEPRRTVVAYRHRVPILILSALVGLVAAAVGLGAIDALSLSRFAARGSESDLAHQRLAEIAGTGTPNVALMVVAADGGVDSPELRAAGLDLTARLSAWPGVASAWSYWTENAPSMRAGDGSAAWVHAHVPGDADTVRRDVLPALSAEFSGPAGAAEVVAAGADEVFRQAADQARADFLRAELVILPLVVGLLWIVYRRLRIALATFGVGLLAVFGALALLRAVAAFTEISTFAANIVLVLGIGLGVDYGLFVTYRFQEELRRRGPDATADALRATVRRAGRTVLYSGLTVAAALAALFAFPYPFLRSFAYAGIAVVATAVVAAVVVLPAALAVLGPRADRRRRRDRPVEQRAWFRIPAAVVRRPVAFGGAGLIVVLGLATPVLGVDFGLPDDRVLPAGAEVRRAYDVERALFGAQDSDALLVVSDTRLAPADLTAYAAALSEVDGIVRVDTAAGAFADGKPVAATASSRLQTDSGTWLAAVPASDRLTGDVTGLVRDVRALPAPSDVLVGGYPAELVDYRDGVVSHLPLIAALITLTTGALLFLMTGSVLVPVVASVLNLLSMAVMFAVLVWGFQDGGLAWLTGFTPTGTVEPSIPILMFCVAYGLSMDYTVFLLSRIQESRDASVDPVAAIPTGIARSAPLVTAAAVTLAASFLVYATGGVVFLQQLGIGMAVAVLVDATLVRGLLLPAALRLLGRAAWWAPAPLTRLRRAIPLEG